MAVVIAVAILWRLPSLDLRPMHNDEAINAVKFGELLQDGKYKYDPHEFHGPSLYYFTLPFAWIKGEKSYVTLQEQTMRLCPLFFSILLIVFLFLLKDALGQWGVICSGVLTALSPMMVYYGRYFIHEMLLVFFTFLLIAGAWRYLQSGQLKWAIVAGIGLGLMYATKETFVFAIVALVGAVAFSVIYDAMFSRKEKSEPFPCCWGCCVECIGAFFNTLKKINLQYLIIGIITAGVVGTIFFTSFFQNWSGPIDSIRTYLPWLERAGGKSPHIHPWYFYFERLLWYKPARSPLWTEVWIFLLAVVGGVSGFLRSSYSGFNSGFVRFLVFYTLILSGIYSVIPYKTPWCALGFWHGFILLGGCGAGVIINFVGRGWKRTFAVIILIGCVAHLCLENWRANYVYYADRCNPYVYAHTVPDIIKLAKTVEGIARVHAEGTNMVVKVIAPEHDYWPLPWYLRSLKNIGWWDKLPEDPYAPVVIVGARFHSELDEKSNKDWIMVGLYALRPNVFFEMYVEFKWWEKYVATLPKERD